MLIAGNTSPGGGSCCLNVPKRLTKPNTSHVNKYEYTCILTHTNTQTQTQTHTHTLKHSLTHIDTCTDTYTCTFAPFAEACPVARCLELRWPCPLQRSQAHFHACIPWPSEGTLRLYIAYMHIHTYTYHIPVPVPVLYSQPSTYTNIHIHTYISI